MANEQKLTIKALKAEMDEKLTKITNILEVLVNEDKKIGETPEAVKAVETGIKSAETTNISSELTTVPSNMEVKIEEGGPQVKVAPEPLNPKYKEVFDKYFDEIDGFIGSYNELESMFTIEVPLTLSNMTDSEKGFYKKDLRSKKVDQNDVLGSMDNWCKLVCQNLKYNRKISLKI